MRGTTNLSPLLDVKSDLFFHVLRLKSFLIFRCVDAGAESCTLVGRHDFDYFTRFHAVLRDEVTF